MMATTVCPPTMVSVSAATMPTLMRTVLAVLARGPPMATPPLSLTTLLEDTATTSTVPAPLTPTGAPRVFTRGRLSPASTAIPMVSMPMMATSTWRGTRMTVTVMATTRGRLSPATPLLSLTTPLMDTAVCPPTMVSVSAATMPTLMRTVLAVLARGPPMATPQLSLTTLLEATATTRTVPAPLTPTG